MQAGFEHVHVNSNTAEDQEIMRHYIRHPADIPIEVIAERSSNVLSDNTKRQLKVEKLENVSFGGLMFQSSIPYVQNKIITVRISSITPRFEASASVSWCRKSGRSYMVGLEFTDKDTEFNIRMVEQVCHIMHYRKKVLETEGRALDKDEAAKEWIERYASKFPK